MPPYFSLSHHRKMPAGEGAWIILIPFLPPDLLLLLMEVRKLGKSSTLDLGQANAGVAGGGQGPSRCRFYWAALQEGSLQLWLFHKREDILLPRGVLSCSGELPTSCLSPPATAATELTNKASIRTHRGTCLWRRPSQSCGREA